MKALFECNRCSRRFYQESELTEFQIRLWKTFEDTGFVVGERNPRGYWEKTVEKLCKECVATSIGSGRYGG